MEHPQQTVEQFIEMRAQGMTYREIQKTLGVSRPTLVEWSRRNHLTISNYRTIEMADLSSDNYLEKKKRVQLLGSALNKIQEELSKRDMSTVPTEKLMKFQLDCVELLKKEEMNLALEGIDDSSPYDGLPAREIRWNA
jgi:transposase